MEATQPAPATRPRDLQSIRHEFAAVIMPEDHYEEDINSQYPFALKTFIVKKDFCFPTTLLDQDFNHGFMIITSAADLTDDGLHAYFFDGYFCIEGKVERIEGSLVISVFLILEAPFAPGTDSIAFVGDQVMLSTLPFATFKE